MRNPPRDQAHGLRQLSAGGLFAGGHAGGGLHFVPLVHNPQVTDAGAVMERLCAAFAAQGHHTLVVDAADSASRPHELARVDLSACVEALSPQVCYLAARGLPMHYLDCHASLSGFLQALRTAAPHASVVLLHASALDLRRMFTDQSPSPVLLAGNRPDSMTHAYTSMKLLSQRLGALAYDLVVVGDVATRRASRMAERLSECADHFLGAALRHVAVLDPLASPHAPLAADLLNLAAGQTSAAGAMSAARHPSAQPVTRSSTSPMAPRPTVPRLGDPPGRLPAPARALAQRPTQAPGRLN